MEKVISLGWNGYNCDRNVRVNRVQIECKSSAYRVHIEEGPIQSRICVFESRGLQ